MKQKKRSHETTRKRFIKGTKADLEDIIIRVRMPEDKERYKQIRDAVALGKKDVIAPNYANEFLNNCIPGNINKE